MDDYSADFEADTGTSRLARLSNPLKMRTRQSRPSGPDLSKWAESVDGDDNEDDGFDPPESDSTGAEAMAKLRIPEPHTSEHDLASEEEGSLGIRRAGGSHRRGGHTHSSSTSSLSTGFDSGADTLDDDDDFDLDFPTATAKLDLRGMLSRAKLNRARQHEEESTIYATRQTGVRFQEDSDDDDMTAGVDFEDASKTLTQARLRKIAGNRSFEATLRAKKLPSVNNFDVLMSERMGGDHTIAANKSPTKTLMSSGGTMKTPRKSSSTDMNTVLRLSPDAKSQLPDANPHKSRDSNTVSRSPDTKAKMSAEPAKSKVSGLRVSHRPSTFMLRPQSLEGNHTLTQSPSKSQLRQQSATPFLPGGAGSSASHHVSSSPTRSRTSREDLKHAFTKTRVIRKKRSAMADEGRGNSLAQIEDLAAAEDEESRFMHMPVDTIRKSSSLRLLRQSREALNDTSDRSRATLNASNPVSRLQSSTSSIPRSAASSTLLRASKSRQFLQPTASSRRAAECTAQKNAERAAARSANTTPRKEPRLIRKEDLRNMPNSSGSMKFNAVTRRWEGEDSIRKNFVTAIKQPQRPALISNLGTKGKPSTPKACGSMVFDPTRLRWVSSTKGAANDDTLEDVFSGLEDLTDDYLIVDAKTGARIRKPASSNKQDHFAVGDEFELDHTWIQRERAHERAWASHVNGWIFDSSLYDNRGRLRDLRNMLVEET